MAHLALDVVPPGGRNFGAPDVIFYRTLGLSPDQVWRPNPPRFLFRQRLERNAEPLGRGGAIREHGDVERRIVGQHGVQFDIMRAVWARHVEGGFHGGPGRGRETPAKRNVKDKIKVKINGIKRRQVGESVERFSATFFDGLNERDNLVDRCFIQDAAWLPEDERQILPKQNVSRKFQIIPKVDATVFS